MPLYLYLYEEAVYLSENSTLDTALGHSFEVCKMMNHRNVCEIYDGLVLPPKCRYKRFWSVQLCGNYEVYGMWVRGGSLRCPCVFCRCTLLWLPATKLVFGSYTPSTLEL